MHPDDITNHSFHPAWGVRGYDREEVDAFLAAVAAEQRSLARQLEELRSAGPSQDALEEVATVLRAAQDAAAAVVAGAHAAAEQILVEARAAATEIESEAERRGVARGVAALRHQQQEVRARLTEVSDEIQLALLALGDGADDAASSRHDVVVES